MDRYGRGEDEVFDHLYRLMAPRLYRFCLRLTGRGGDADDCFQETMLRLHRARATYLTGGDPLAWAFAIARSLHIDRLRYRRRRPEEVGQASDAAAEDRLRADDRYSPELAMRARDLQAFVTAELGRMSERNRVAYVLIREEGLSAGDAAAVLGTTADAVRQRAHRAHAQLRSALGAAGWTDDDRPDVLDDGGTSRTRSVGVDGRR
jgi:RNA polymerase sigma-70 factor, ECF subfamily